MADVKSATLSTGTKVTASAEVIARVAGKSEPKAAKPADGKPKSK